MDVPTARRLSRARQLVDLRRWHDAVAELELVVAAEPQSVEALCMLGQSRLNLGDPGAGCQAAEAALALDPDHEWAHRVHSVALGATGRHDQAVAAARTAVRLAPQYADGHQRLAHALLHLPGRAAEARAAAERAVELDPHDPNAHVAVGLAVGGLGDRRREREAYLRALAIDPAHATALNNLAAIDTECGRLGGASRLLTSALGSDPHHRTALANLDVVAVHVLRRMTAVMVLGGLLVAVLAVAGADGGGRWPVSPWLRSVAGVAVIGAGGLVGWSSLRHLPAGARHHLRGLPRRASGGDRALGIAFVVVTVSLAAAAFLPGDAAEWGSAGVLPAVCLGWLAVVAGLGRAIHTRLGRRR